MVLYRQQLGTNFVGGTIACGCLTVAELLIMGPRSMKATGHDGISAQYLHVHLPTSASKLLPLMAKTTLSLCEPVAFKGGSLLVLAKRAGAATQRGDFRSILVERAPAKLYHKALRNRLVPALVSHELQCGATPGSGIEALALLARTVQDCAVASHKRWGMVFYNLHATFYRVVRVDRSGSGMLPWPACWAP